MLFPFLILTEFSRIYFVTTSPIFLSLIYYSLDSGYSKLVTTFQANALSGPGSALALILFSSLFSNLTTNQKF